MADLVGTPGWEAYKALINDAHDTFNQDIIVWKQWLFGIDRFGEDNEAANFASIDLKCLIQYNAFRTWPVNRHSEEGKLDKNTIYVLFNRNYLSGLGYLDASGNFKVDIGKDHFIHRGITYSAEGDTLLSQAYNDPLLVGIVMQRQERLTSEPEDLAGGPDLVIP